MSTPIRHVSEVVKDTRALLEFLHSDKKLNIGFFDLLPGTITTIAGRSGAGKSLLLDNIRNELSKRSDVEVLSFELEMLAEYQILRSVCALQDVRLNDVFEGKVEAKLDELENKNIYFVNEVLNSSQLVSIITNFVERSSVCEHVVITIDHALLANSAMENSTIGLEILMSQLIVLKKKYALSDKKLYFIVLSQLNRDIESPDRVVNMYRHLPNRADIFGSSAIFMASDYVFVIHNPARVPGLAHFYTHKQHPLFSEQDAEYIWVHMLKNRFGELVHWLYEEDYAKGKLRLVEKFDDKHFSFT